MLFDAAIELLYNNIPIRTGCLIDKCAVSREISNNFLNGIKTGSGQLIFANNPYTSRALAGFRNPARGGWDILLNKSGN